MYAPRSLAALNAALPGNIYATRPDTAPDRLARLFGRVAGRVGAETGWSKLSQIQPEVAEREQTYVRMSDAGIRQAALETGLRLKSSWLDRTVVADAFAMIRVVAERQLGMRLFDVQIVGGWAILNRMIAEMETGEGKTLTATLPVSVAALAGIPVHVITVNDYLAARDAENMRPIYEALGLSVATALDHMSDDERRAAYACDVVYTTNKQVAFDHLRDRLAMRGEENTVAMLFKNKVRESLLLRGLYFAVIDEADSVLVDEAVTPLIISRRGKPLFSEEILREALTVARLMRAPADFSVNRSERRLKLHASGERFLESWAKGKAGLWQNTRYRQELVVQALRALFLYERDNHYLVQDDQVKIIDEFTGRVMEGRSWEQGLHQLIEAKEGCPLTGDMETTARISYQRFFRRYLMIGGMSGTVQEVAAELKDVYELDVARIPTHKQCRRRAGQRVILPGETEKWQSVVGSIRAAHEIGRPVLIGTRSVFASETLSRLLTLEGLPHNVLNARSDGDEALIVADAGKRGQITVATNMAGRGTDIKLGEGVADLGGLLVIATERHEARRIDRQLFGRCARQGDPGRFEEILSLDDQLVHIYTPDWILAVARRLARKGGVVAAGACFVVVCMAQRRAQRRSARMRVRMQKMDEYLGNVLAFSGKLD